MQVISISNLNSVNMDYWNKLVSFRNNIEDVIKAKELLEDYATDPLEREYNKKGLVIDKMKYFTLDINKLRKIAKNASKRIVKLTKKDKELRKSMAIFFPVDE